MNDTRYGRFFTVDPLREKYPELSCYQFASNTPIQAIDLDGKEAEIIILDIYRNSAGQNWGQKSVIKNDGNMVNGYRYENLVSPDEYGKRGTLKILNLHDVVNKNGEVSGMVTAREFKIGLTDRLFNSVEKGLSDYPADGLNLYSLKGVETDLDLSTKWGNSSLPPINIDLLVSTLGGVGNPTHQADVTKWYDLARDVVTAAQTLNSAVSKGDAVQSSIDDLKRNKTKDGQQTKEKKNDSTTCEFCHHKISKETLKGSGVYDYQHPIPSYKNNLKE